MELLALSPDMMRFVDADVSRGVSVVRHRRLLSKLEKAGYFNNPYAADVNNTAAQAFADKRGNCISYTSMFVALARHAGLKVHYQVVETRYPSYQVYAGLMMRNNHINAYVETPRIDFADTRGETVDFNVVTPEEVANRRLVDDEFALSLFFANLAAEALMDDQARAGFAYLRRALELAPRNADLWVNLGAFYALHDQFEAALEAYNVALNLAPQERAVWSGLGRTLQALGRDSEAAEYLTRVRNYRSRNPHYHFALAQTHYDAGDFVAALQAADRAIAYDKNNARFLFMRGVTLYRLGRREEGAEVIRAARAAGRFDDLWLRFATDLDV